MHRPHNNENKILFVEKVYPNLRALSETKGDTPDAQVALSDTQGASSETGAHNLFSDGKFIIFGRRYL